MAGRLWCPWWPRCSCPTSPSPSRRRPACARRATRPDGSSACGPASHWSPQQVTESRGHRCVGQHGDDRTPCSKGCRAAAAQDVVLLGEQPARPARGPGPLEPLGGGFPVAPLQRGEADEETAEEKGALGAAEWLVASRLWVHSAGPISQIPESGSCQRRSMAAAAMKIAAQPSGSSRSCRSAAASSCRHSPNASSWNWPLTQLPEVLADLGVLVLRALLARVTGPGETAVEQGGREPVAQDRVHSGQTDPQRAPECSAA